MKFALMKIKKTNAFKDRKIADLLEWFGKRHCQSHLDFERDYDIESDPRKTITWPVSPTEFEDLLQRIDNGFHFTLKDRMGPLETDRGDDKFVD